LHRFNAQRQEHWPRALAPLSTHDTKRSEDVRARVNVLSELPEEWAAAVRRWAEMNAARRAEAGKLAAPDANEEYLLYQTLLGAWPPCEEAPGAEFADRIANYMVKALHEAKTHSSWVNPNATYDAAVGAFVRRVLDAEQARDFLDDFRPFQRRVARLGAINTLSQTLLKVASPGVADTYQGTELPDFSLVDPDNRRPVDYARRQAMLNDLRGTAVSAGDDRAALARELIGSVEDGRAKLYVTWRALTARRDHPGLFAEGEYFPLPAEGEKARHLFAFARRLGGAAAVVAVPRLVARLTLDGSPPLGKEWADTRADASALRCAAWRDALTGRRLAATDGRLAAAELFSHFTVALLFRDE
jgi:(1->4)-alpha-D-glucan 1-alpha-D-glucosylmutase